MESVRVIWGGEREAFLEVRDRASAAAAAALADARIDGIAEIVPGSRTVLVRVEHDADPDRVLGEACSVVRDTVSTPSPGHVRRVEIPICSDPDLAPDLDEVARRAGFSPSEAAAVHASAEYTVRFIGFTPGFPYIDGLPEALRIPRLDTPRTRVRAGSVGITGLQTGIYPFATPGGWRLIGATPLTLFDPERAQPSLLLPGDRVRFRRICRDEFENLATESA